MGYGQYDAINRGGSAGGTVAIGSANSTDVFGRGISTMTVAEVMNLHRQNKVHAAGLLPNYWLHTTWTDE